MNPTSERCRRILQVKGPEKKSWSEGGRRAGCLKPLAPGPSHVQAGTPKMDKAGPGSLDAIPPGIISHETDAALGHAGAGRGEHPASWS